MFDYREFFLSLALSAAEARSVVHVMGAYACPEIDSAM